MSAGVEELVSNVEPILEDSSIVHIVCVDGCGGVDGGPYTTLCGLVSSEGRVVGATKNCAVCVEMEAECSRTKQCPRGNGPCVFYDKGDCGA